MTTDHTPTPMPDHPGFWNYWSVHEQHWMVHHAEDIPDREYAAMSETDRERILGSIAPDLVSCGGPEIDENWDNAQSGF